jgi:hypothetical protein
MIHLRDIYLTRMHDKTPLLEREEVRARFNAVIAKGEYEHSADACLILSIMALAAVWGHYPDDARRLRSSIATPASIDESSTPSTMQAEYTMSVPEHQFKESSIYLSMAHQRMAAAYTEDSPVGVLCFQFLGCWHMFNFEPIQGWKMFRTASSLWETFNSKGRPPTEKEQSKSPARYSQYIP